jgi:hypothetical protein
LAVEGIDQGPEVFGVEADGHGVDGKVAAQLVILDCARFDIGVPRFGAVAFFPGADKFYFQVFPFDLCGAEILEKGDRWFRLQAGCHFMRQLDAVAGADDIGVLCGAADQPVTYKPTDEVAGYLQVGRGLRDLLEDERFFIGAFGSP